jgi:hypothetical protein
MAETKRQFTITTLVAIIAVVMSVAMPTVNMIYTSRMSAKAEIEALVQSVNELKVSLSVKIATLETRLDDHINAKLRMGR